MGIDSQKLGKSIAVMRKDRGINQKELSELIHITPTHMSNIEHGRTLPSFSTFIDICAVLNVNPDFLISGTAYPDLSNELTQKLKMCSDIQKDVVLKLVNVFLFEMNLQ